MQNRNMQRGKLSFYPNLSKFQLLFSLFVTLEFIFISMASRSRGRAARRGETRMDAALDAMTPFGFPNKLVRQTVSELLKVYGGNNGWVFIEEAAYTLLIDTLLEKQQQEEQQTVPLPPNCLKEDNQGNGSNETSLAGCSNQSLLPCSNAEISNDAPQPMNRVADTISAGSETGNQVPVMAVDATSATEKTVYELPIKRIGTSLATSQFINQPSIKAVDTVSAGSETRNQVPVMAVDATSATKKTVDELPIKKPTATSARKKTVDELPLKKRIGTSLATSQLINQPSIKAVDTVPTTDENDYIKAKDTVSADKESGKHRSIKPAATVPATAENDSKEKAFDNVSLNKESESAQTKSSQPMGRLCHKRRRPCYGWISRVVGDNDEVEEGEIIELPPGPLANTFYKLVSDKVSYS